MYTRVAGLSFLALLPILLGYAINLKVGQATPGFFMWAGLSSTLVALATGYLCGKLPLPGRAAYLAAGWVPILMTLLSLWPKSPANLGLLKWAGFYATAAARPFGLLASWMPAVSVALSTLGPPLYMLALYTLAFYLARWPSAPRNTAA